MSTSNNSGNANEDLVSNDGSSTDAWQHNQELDPRARNANTTRGSSTNAEDNEESEEIRESEEAEEIEEAEETEEDEQLENIEEAEGAEDSVTLLAPANPINSHIKVVNVVQGLPLVKVSDLPIEDRTCCICRTEYFHNIYVITAEMYAREFPGRIDEETQEKCVPVKMRCGHIVGDRCIVQWIDSSLSRFMNARCPVCRIVIERAPPQPNESWDMVAWI